MKTRLLKALVVTLSSVALAWLSATTNAGPLDRRIPYSGRLEAASGPTTVAIELFAQPVGGSPVWGPELQQATPDESGRFALQIGASGLDRCHLVAGSPVCDAGDGLPDLDQLDASGPLYVAVRLPGSTGMIELAPRQSLFPAFHALGVESAGSGLPVGTVLPFWGSVSAIPESFELCDGALPTTPGATLLGPKPDLRAKFARGTEIGIPDVTTPRTGGSDALTGLPLSGHALTRAQLPNTTVDLDTAIISGAGSHGHTWIRTATGTEQRCVGDDEGTAETHYTLGSTAARTCPSMTTSSDGHGHSLGGGTLSSGGSGQTHAHTYSVPDNRPAFLEVLFIIRVR